MSGRTAYSAIRTSRPIPKGGSGILTQALAKFIEAHNGVVLTNKAVTRLIVENGKCVGVECADGSSYRARESRALHDSRQTVRRHGAERFVGP